MDLEIMWWQVPPAHLYGLKVLCSAVDHFNLPHSKRVPVFNMRFRPVQASFHSPVLNVIAEEFLEKVGDARKREDLACPVFHTMT